MTSRMQQRRPPPAREPQTIDLVYAGVAPDGTPVYDSPLIVLGRDVILLFVDHPAETCRVVALAAVAGACLYFAHDALKPRKSRV